MRVYCGTLPTAAVGLLTGVALVAGCSNVATHQTAPAAGPAWPEVQPRVRLERIIAIRRDLKGAGTFLNWLGGRRDEFLFERPYGIAWDGNDLLVADPGARRVFRISDNAGPRTTPDGLLHEPVGVASCGSGIVVTDTRAGKVLLFTRDLKSSAVLAENLSRPTGVACRGDVIFVTETGQHRVLVLEGGKLTRAFGRRGTGEAEFNFPTSIAVTPTEIIVGDTLNFRTQRFDRELTRCTGIFGTLGDAPGEMPRIKGAAVDRDGHLWVSDGHLDQVALFETAGTFLMAIGRSGSEPGEFSFPAGIAANDDGRVAVADSLNRRVQVFKLVGESEVPR